MAHASTLVFDIETIPDIDGLYRLGLIENTHTDTVKAYLETRQIAKGNSFLPLHLQKIVAISCVFRRTHQGKEQLHVKSLGLLESNEKDLIQDFFKLIDKYQPQLVSWNGGGFDLPVLQQRALILGVSAMQYWDLGDREEANSKQYKWNNYINRYHFRHLDLMDVLAMYQMRANAGLDDIAKLCGLPGKMGMDGAKVWDAYLDGQLQAIRDYCETDVVNTYLVFQRFQAMRFDCFNKYEDEVEFVKNHLNELPGEHWQAYLQGFKSVN